MTPDPGGTDDSGTARRRRILVVAGVVLIAAIASGTALYRSNDDHPSADLTVGWDGSEGHPPCVYDEDGRTVVAKLTIDGTAPRRKTVTVTVTAYADENTSQAVGSSSRSVLVEGNVHRPLRLTIPVTEAAHVDEDGVAACRLAVTY